MREDEPIVGLDQWTAPEPPAGFADRVMAARDANAQKSPRRRLRALLGAALLVGSAAAWLLAARAGDAAGEVALDGRASVKIGRRGVAVGEAGARLQYRVHNGDARVRQAAGNVFYRVEHGGPFVVSTPAGEVTVQGTCFRVEVEPMPMKGIERKSMVAAGVGAIAAATILVTVYEGRVLLANEHGKTVLSAGEQAGARSGEAPAPAHDAVAQNHDAVAQNSAPPAEGITREQLLARDQQQRAELDKLRVRVHELEGAAPAGGKAAGKDDRPFFEPDKEELQAMARDCKLKWDNPTIGLNPPTLSARRASTLGLSDQERVEIDRVSAEENARVLKELRALYVEVTGDKAGAESLAPQAMENEIMSKSPEAVVQQTFYKLSHERAGLQAAPADLRGAPASERLMRLMTGLGDDYEQRLGAAIGPDRAHQLRAENNGWDSRNRSMVGCPGE
jgi:ferric-dicitrate binding protein FerR (iron transport regulator)